MLNFVLQLDSNEFCSSMRLPERVYEAGVEPPDDPKVIIQHSRIDYVEKVAAVLGKKEFSQIENSHIGSIVKLARKTSVGFSESLFHFLMQRRVLTKGESLWFTFADQPMRFSMREFHLATGLACEEDRTEVKVRDRVVKKPYLWMLGKKDRFTVETLYELFKNKARGMTTLERFSLGVAIITEGVIVAEKPGTLILKERMLCYMNYRISKGAWGRVAYNVLSKSIKSLDSGSWLGDGYEVSGFVIAINLWAMSSVSVLGQSLGKSCETSSSSDPLVLHWDSTKSKTITEVSTIEKIDNVSFYKRL